MRVGQRITMGAADDRESGIIDSINGVQATVRWDSGVVTTQPIAEVNCLDLMSGEDFCVHVVDVDDDSEVSREIEAYIRHGVEHYELVAYQVETDDGRAFDGIVSA